MKILLLLAMFFMLCGCQTSAPLFSPLLSEAQVIAIAKQFAKEQNRSLEGYQRVDTTFDSKFEEWDVSFSWTNNTGVSFVIDDETGIARDAVLRVTVTEGVRLPPNHQRIESTGARVGGP